MGKAEECGGEGVIWGKCGHGGLQRRREESEQESEGWFGHVKGVDPSGIVVRRGIGEKAVEPAL